MTLNDLNMCIVDIETTGARSLGHRIIEIGVVKIEKGKQVDQFHSLINPQQPIPSSIVEFTGITDDDVKNSPIFEDIHRSLLSFLDGYIFVAHNVIFDYGFIRQEFNRLGVSFNLERFCSVKLSRLLFPDQSKHDLSSIIERHHIPLKNRHRALDDAQGVWRFFEIVQQEIAEERQHQGLLKVLRSSKLMPYELSIDHLPHALGVYMFYGVNDTVLYIGKSNDIRSKVWDHLVDDPRFSHKGSQVKRVDDVECQGKLGASLLESYLIKKHQPLFNRRSRTLDQMTTLSLRENDLGYKYVHLETHPTIQKEQLQQAYTVFRTKKHALKFLEGIAKKYQICKIFLGSEQICAQGCSDYHQGFCRGACLRLEKAVVHNIRLIEALSKHRKIDWPFTGPIVIEENNALKTKGEAIVIDQWIIQQAFQYDAHAKDLLFKADNNFDFDTYRILFNYFLKNNRVKTIMPYKNFSHLGPHEHMDLH